MIFEHYFKFSCVNIIVKSTLMTQNTLMALKKVLYDSLTSLPTIQTILMPWTHLEDAYFVVWLDQLRGYWCVNWMCSQAPVSDQSQ